MLSTRPGKRLSHSRISAFISARFRFGWLPHRLHGMIGNSRSSAYFSRSVSFTYASGRITTFLPSSDCSFGGIPFSLPP